MESLYHKFWNPWSLVGFWKLKQKEQQKPGETPLGSLPWDPPLTGKWPVVRVFLRLPRDLVPNSWMGATVLAQKPHTEPATTPRAQSCRQGFLEAWAPSRLRPGL